MSCLHWLALLGHRLTFRLRSSTLSYSALAASSAASSAATSACRLCTRRVFPLSPPNTCATRRPSAPQIFRLRSSCTVTPVTAAPVSCSRTAVVHPPGNLSFPLGVLAPAPSHGQSVTLVQDAGPDAHPIRTLLSRPTCWPDSSRELMPRRFWRSSFSSACTVSSASSRSLSALATACAAASDVSAKVQDITKICVPSRPESCRLSLVQGLSVPLGLHGLFSAPPHQQMTG